MANENIENLDSTNEEVETDTEETVDIETEESDEVDVEKPQYTDLERKLFARAKKAETELKKFKTSPKDTAPQKTDLNKTQTPSLSDIEATVLKAQGMSDDLLSELKVIAQVRGKSLLDAQKDALFISIKEAREAEEKSKKASLGASKGSRQVQVKKDFSTPTTEDEHKAMWMERQGR